MTYSIDGVALDNPAFGWTFMRSGTKPFAGIVRNRSEIRVPGYDGYFAAPATTEAKTIVFRVTTPQDSLEPLLALVDSGRVLTRTDDPSRVADFELVSAIPSGNAPSDAVLDLAITLAIPGASWRDFEPQTFGPVTITNPTQTVDLLAGISAPVRDADLFIGGVFGEFQLVDSAGSWLRSTAPISSTSSTGILYVGLTGQAFTATTAAPWTPTADISHLVDVGADGFKLTPHLEPGNPADRRARLTLTTLEQTGVTFRLRARGAYAIQ